MTTIEERMTNGPRPHAANPRHYPLELHEAVSAVKAEFREARAALGRSLRLQRKALRLAAFDSAYKAGIGLVYFGLALTMSIAAALLGLSGLREGLVVWTHGAWWADLLLALFVALALAASALALRRRVFRSILIGSNRVFRGAPVSSPANPQPAR